MTRSFQDPPDHALAEVLRWPTERSREWTCRLINSARADRSILAVVAIGSTVRPKIASADLDLIVIRADAATLGDAVPLEIDLRIYSSRDVDAQITNGHDLLGWAIKFGRVLFQRNHYWDQLVNAWKIASRCLPRQLPAKGRQVPSAPRQGPGVRRCRCVTGTGSFILDAPGPGRAPQQGHLSCVKAGVTFAASRHRKFSNCGVARQPLAEQTAGIGGD